MLSVLHLCTHIYKSYTVNPMMIIGVARRRQLWGYWGTCPHRLMMMIMTMIAVMVLVVDRPQKIVWLGSDGRGRRREDAYCSGWTSSSVTVTGSGTALLSKRRLLAADVDYACSNAFILLCVETSYRRR